VLRDALAVLCDAARERNCTSSDGRLRVVDTSRGGGKRERAGGESLAFSCDDGEAEVGDVGSMTGTLLTTCVQKRLV
jgi:hypothetical protein